MALDPDLKNALYAVVGAVAATIVGAIPSAWKGIRKDIGDEAVRRKTELELAQKVGAQGQRLDDLEGDIQGVADMVRKRFDDLNKSLDARFEKLKLKDTAIETLLTGELPRITTGELEAAS